MASFAEIRLRIMATIIAAITPADDRFDIFAEEDEPALTIVSEISDGFGAGEIHVFPSFVERDRLVVHVHGQTGSGAIRLDNSHVSQLYTALGGYLSRRQSLSSRVAATSCVNP